MSAHERPQPANYDKLVETYTSHITAALIRRIQTSWLLSDDLKVKLIKCSNRIILEPVAKGHNNRTFKTLTLLGSYIDAGSEAYVLYLDSSLFNNLDIIVQRGSAGLEHSVSANSELVLALLFHLFSVTEPSYTDESDFGRRGFMRVREQFQIPNFAGFADLGEIPHEEIDSLRIEYVEEEWRRLEIISFLVNLSRQNPVLELFKAVSRTKDLSHSSEILHFLACVLATDAEKHEVLSYSRMEALTWMESYIMQMSENGFREAIRESLFNLVSDLMSLNNYQFQEKYSDLWKFFLPGTASV